MCHQLLYYLLPNSLSVAFLVKYDAAIIHGLDGWSSRSIFFDSSLIRTRTSSNSNSADKALVVAIILDDDGLFGIESFVSAGTVDDILDVSPSTTTFMLSFSELTTEGKNCVVVDDDDEEEEEEDDDASSCGTSIIAVAAVAVVASAFGAASVGVVVVVIPNSYNVSSIPDAKYDDPSSKSIATIASGPHAPKQTLSSTV